MGSPPGNLRTANVCSPRVLRELLRPHSLPTRAASGWRGQEALRMAPTRETLARLTSNRGLEQPAQDE